jgi:diaminopimelate epimerase
MHWGLLTARAIGWVSHPPISSERIHAETPVGLVTQVSMGNPHNLIYAKDGAPIDVASLPLESIGSEFENLPIFPARTNTEFVEVRARCPV